MAREPLLITAPVRLPVLPGDAREHIRVADSVEDPVIERMIGDATEAAENYCRSLFITQTWAHYFDVFADEMLLQFSPLAATSPITSVVYTDADGVSQTVASTVYETGQRNGQALLRLQFDQTWPTDARSQDDVIVVTAVHGYGDPADVPERIKQAIRFHVANDYEHREGEVDIMKVFHNRLTPYRFARMVS